MRQSGLRSRAVVKEGVYEERKRLGTPGESQKVRLGGFGGCSTGRDELGRRCRMVYIIFWASLIQPDNTQLGPRKHRNREMV